MTGPIIETPRGKVFIDQNMMAQLEWNPDFKDKWQGRYSRAQKFVDSEVLRYCEPYIPLLTGMLIASGILGTFVGSGMVSWIAPYSRRQYYSPRPPGSYSGPLRGPHWFERMKPVWGPSIIAGARRIAGGGER